MLGGRGKMLYDRLIDELPFEKMTDEVKHNWAHAEVFEIDNVANYIYQQCDQEYFKDEEFPNVAPCFPNMFFEYSQPEWWKSDGKVVKNTSPVKKVGVLITSKELDVSKDNIKWYTTAIAILEFRSVPHPNKFQIRRDSKFHYYTEMKYLVTNDGRLHFINDKGFAFYVLDPRFMNKGLFFSPWMALSFLHCKNVSDEVVDQNEAINSSRIKRGKHPLCKYHILNIGFPKNKLNEAGAENHEGLGKALHICRGHFKDFSKGGGLFGKYQGLYWWEAQVRGKMSDGVVLKDYKVLP
jgi:hypothetical protein